MLSYLCYHVWLWWGSRHGMVEALTHEYKPVATKCAKYAIPTFRFIEMLARRNRKEPSRRPIVVKRRLCDTLHIQY